MWLQAGRYDSTQREFFLTELGMRTEALTQESYLLVHRVNFTLEDVLGMTGLERTEYLDLYWKEVERENEKLESVGGK